MTKKPGRTADEANYGDLPDLVGYQLRRTQKAVFSHFSKRLASVGLSPGQFGVLTLIEANTGLSQSALAAILGIERSTMVAVIDGLEGKGWVERKPSTTDRRSYALRLKKKGTALLKRARPKVADHERDIAAGLSDAEQAVQIDLLGRVTAAAKKD